MPTHGDETLHDRYAREHADHMARLAKLTPEQIAEMELSLHNALAEVDRLRAQLPSQGGEAVEVLTTWHPDSRSYEEQIVRRDTKGSRKALGAMNARLREKVGRLEREVATVKQSLTVEPVAYAAFADNGNIRMWCRSAIGMCELFDAHGNKAVPLYTHPADQVDSVVVSRELFMRALSESTDDLNGKFSAREELRALLAKSEGVKQCQHIPLNSQFGTWCELCETKLD